MRILLYSLCFLLPLTTIAQTQNKGITVTGKGVVKVTPDKVKIKVRVENESSYKSSTGPDKIKAKTDETVDKVLKFLKKSNIAKEDYKTDYIHLDKSYDYQTKSYNYKAEQAITITLRNLDNYESLMNGLIKLGINRIDGINFQTSELEKHKSEARKKAIQNAKQKAEEYASALGQKIGSAEMISETATHSPRPMYNTMMSEAKSSGDSAQQTLAVGQMQVTAQVQVRFVLKE